jgi:hypothetical protein
MNLQELKKEAQGKILSFAMNGQSNLEELNALVDTLIDKVVDAVEESVVPEKLTDETTEDSEYAEAYDECRDDVLEAFRTFKGV